MKKEDKIFELIKLEGKRQRDTLSFEECKLK